MRQSALITVILAVLTSVFGIFIRAPETMPKDLRGSDPHVFKVPSFSRGDCFSTRIELKRS